MLTVAAIRKLQPHPTRRREIRDNGAPGLYLVIQPKPKGTKSWAMRFRRPDGKPAKLTLGRVDLGEREPSDEAAIGAPLTLLQARELANRIHRDRARKIDVVAELKAEKHRERTAAAVRGANTFSTCVREFFADHRVARWGTRPRRWREDARILGLNYPGDCDDPTSVEPEVLRGSLCDMWSRRPIVEISNDDIFEIVDSARRGGIPGLPRHNKGISDARGRKMYACLTGLLRWCLRHRRLRVNPMIGIERPNGPIARQHLLSDDEIRWFWRGCDRIESPWGLIFKMLLLTGTRRNEVAGMRRDELSDDNTVWTVPSSRTKNHRPHLVPLAPVARTLIAETPVIGDGNVIFTLTGHPLTGFSRAKARLDATMLAVAREEDPDATIAPWRLHDLRRVISTGMHEKLGIAPHMVEAVLNHVSGHKSGVAGTYNVSEYKLEKAAALERWAAYVAGIVERRPANVVAMRTRRAHG